MPTYNRVQRGATGTQWASAGVPIIFIWLMPPVQPQPRI
jgi:hypothetical protein